MPIFHDPHESPLWRTASRQMSSDGEQRGEFEHDISPLGSLQLDNMPGTTARHEPVSPGLGPPSHDRNELIERIKRVKSPLWQFRQDVSRPLLI